jgi:hypothetical protein
MSDPDFAAGTGNTAAQDTGCGDPRSAANTSPAPGPARLAFYGRSNQRGCRAQSELSCQLEQCRASIAGTAAITRTYWDCPESAPKAGPARTADGEVPSPGGWAALVSDMCQPASGRGFDAIICLSASRISRSLPVLLAREELARRLGIPILYADQPRMPDSGRKIIRLILGSPHVTGQGSHGAR